MITMIITIIMIMITQAKAVNNEWNVSCPRAASKLYTCLPHPHHSHIILITILIAKITIILITITIVIIHISSY